ncbi:MAG: glycoside hydrolase family 18 protein [Armatimonadaceae bacterium]
MNRVVLGYFTDWNSDFGPDRIDYRMFTHLCHAFALISAEGEVRLPNSANTVNLIRRAHRAGTKVLLSVGGADSNAAFCAATRTPLAAGMLANQLAAQVKAAGYDGVDVDWEAPTNPDDKLKMELFVRLLRQRLPKALLTMATPATDWSGKWFSRTGLMPHLDWVHVMSYDLYGPWSNRAGHNAGMGPADGDPKPEPALTVPAAIDYWLKQKQWDPNKLALGIPLYGRGFRATQWGDAASGSYERSGVSYNDALTLQKNGWRLVRDVRAQVPYLIHPEGNELVSFEDPESARRKGEFARQRKLAGIFFWEIAQDFDGKTHALVRAARQGFLD